MSNPKALQAAISKPADKIECGHLLAKTLPISFIYAVIKRIESLEKQLGASHASSK